MDMKSELDTLKQQRNLEAYRWEEQARKFQWECQQLRPEATNFRKLQRVLGTEKSGTAADYPGDIVSTKTHHHSKW